MKLSHLFLIIIILSLIPVANAAIIPEANFTANATTVCTYQTIQFNDISISAGTISAWFWLFGDSQDSHIQNPTHYYDTPGVYNVSLWVQDEWGEDTLVKYNYITVNDCYTAEFSANQTCTIGTPAIVQLNSTCYDVPLGKTTWLIYPHVGGWSYWNGTQWVIDSDGIFGSDLAGTLDPVINFTAYGSYNVTQACNYGGIIGTVELTKYNYIIIGVPGTYCTGNCSAFGGGGNNNTTTLSLAVVLAFVPIWVLIALSGRKK